MNSQSTGGGRSAIAGLYWPIAFVIGCALVSIGLNSFGPIQHRYDAVLVEHGSAKRTLILDRKEGKFRAADDMVDPSE